MKAGVKQGGPQIDPASAGLRAWQRRMALRRLRTLTVATIISGLVGAAYGLFFYGDYLLAPDAVDPWRGFRTGAMIGFLVAALELFLLRPARRTWIRRIAFLPGLILRIVAITIIIRAVLVLNTAITNWRAGEPFFSNMTAGAELRDTMFSLFFVLFFVTLSQLSAIIGFKRFINLVVGRYFKPVAENRIFLFVDLVDSTPLARRLGDVQFHEFLSDFFYQLDIAIVRYGGEVVSYVGDCVIVTWPMSKDPKKNARAIRALRAMRLSILTASDAFQKSYGTVPAFRAAMNGGPVVVGECGDSRRQVTYLGDTVNVAGRIEAFGKEIGEPYLITKSLAEKMDVPNDVSFEPVGTPMLKGLETGIALERINLAS